MHSRQDLSVIILAGGESSRMGSEKAFLLHNGTAFISTIAAQMSKVSDDVVVMTGKKDVRQFEPYLEREVRVSEDDLYLSNPLGGIVSGLDLVRHSRTALVACDAPLVKAGAIKQLSNLLGRHAAAVPVWGKDTLSTMEPLCAVYRVGQARKAAAAALRGDRKTVKRMVVLMEDVLFVDVSLLQRADPSLGSLVDVNTREDYAALGSRQAPQALVSRGVIRRRDGQ